MSNAYTQEYVDKWEIIDDELYDSPALAWKRKQELHQDGWEVLLDKVSFDGVPRWFINAKRLKVGR